MATLQKKLKAAQSAFAKARKKVEEGGTGGEFFDETGRFDCQLTNAEVNESQNNRLQAFLEWTVLDGEFKGETFRSYYGLEKEENIAFLLKDIVRLGHEAPEDIEELEDLLESMVKAKPKIKIKRVQKGEFVNNYLQKLIEGDDEGESEDTDNGKEPEKEPEEFKPETGQRVQHAKKGAGVVKSIDEDDKDAVVKFDSGDKETVSWDELSAEEEKPADEKPAEEGGDEITVGMQILVEKHGLGKIVEIDEDDAKVTVKLETGKKVTVGVDALSLPPKEKGKMRVGKK